MTTLAITAAAAEQRRNNGGENDQVRTPPQGLQHKAREHRSHDGTNAAHSESPAQACGANGRRVKTGGQHIDTRLRPGDEKPQKKRRRGDQ